MLSYPGCHMRATYIGHIGTQAHGRQVTSLLLLKWRHHVKLHLSVFRDFWKLTLKFKKKNKWLARKRIHYYCEGRIEKFVLRDHRLSSLGKPRDAKRWSSGRIFYPTFKLMMDSFIIYKVMKYRKILIKYNAYLKKMYFTVVKISKVVFSLQWKYKLYFTGEIGCPLLSPLTSLSPLQNFKCLQLSY